ncbi:MULTISPECIES: dethiobiotin synthase [unclassified Phenylobacterium]|uniref:dethiobiotin synthase n=1 Tax=unclassified Phenylobacterium TaxID=2640670 RepID=UPI00083A003D|nr:MULTISPECIES: dethiobiotin synthase [unclassified Phenylobacterium]
MTTKTLFVAGAHTEIGKTWVACALLRAARAEGLSVAAAKPVVSGFDEARWADSDPGRLLAACGAELTPPALDEISPWRYQAPVAPPSAARLEARALPFSEVVAYARQRVSTSGANLMVVEAVGGLMSPFADGATSLDLMTAIGGPNVLVVGSYLGAVSHGLTALEVLRARQLRPAALVVSERGAADDLPLEGTLALLREHVRDPPVIGAPTHSCDWARAVLTLSSN